MNDVQKAVETQLKNIQSKTGKTLVELMQIAQQSGLSKHSELRQLFQRELGIPSVLMGFGLPDDNLHAPNEKFHLPNLYLGIDAVSRFFEVLTTAP